MRHPAHDAVAAEVASWYTSPAPGMGYLLEPRWCGLFTTPASLIGPRVILRVDNPEDASRAVMDIVETYGDQQVEVWIEGRDGAAELYDPLLAAGCRLRTRTVYLALVGAISAVSAPSGLQIEVVDADGLWEWATVRHMGFENSEDKPADELLAAEVKLRTVEHADVAGSGWLGSMAKR